MNKTVRNTIASVTAAAAGAVGIYLATDTAVEPEAFTLPSIDLSQYDITYPTLSYPAISYPETALPSLDLPTIDTPTLETPKLDTAVITYPVYNSTEIDYPLAGTVTLDLADVGLDVKAVEVIDLDYPELPPPPDINRTMTDYLAMSKMVIDQRNLEYSKCAYLDKWVEIYRKHLNDAPMEYLPLPSGLRIITEIRKPESMDEYVKLQRNLAYYKEAGYNAALVVFRGSETASDMANLARLVKTYGMYVFFAFGGRESLQDEIYIDPAYFENMLKTLAPLCEGYVPWRRSSLHLFVPDVAYNNYVASILRKANPQIKILGEVYYGYTGINHPQIYLAYNVPKNCSGVLLKNYGFKGIYLQGVVKAAKKKIPAIAGLPILGVTVGERAYYLSRYPNRKTFAQNLKIKAQIEKRFIRSGCAGTITYSDDISDGIYSRENPNVTNNLSQLDLSKEVIK